MGLANAPVCAVLPAEDIKRAKKFWTEKIGLTIDEEMPQTGDVIFSAGKGTKIYMYQRARTKAEHTVASFLVDDLEKTMKELRANGVKFEDYDFPGLKTVNGIATFGNEKAAWFTDPEGNIVALSEMK